METDLDVLKSSVYLVYCLDSGRPLVAIQRQRLANGAHISLYMKLPGGRLESVISSKALLKVLYNAI